MEKKSDQTRQKGAEYESAGKKYWNEKVDEAKKKAEDERLSKLSAAEQKKVSKHLCMCLRHGVNVRRQAMDREKKRLLRKTQGKVKMR